MIYLSTRFPLNSEQTGNAMFCSLNPYKEQKFSIFFKFDYLNKDLKSDMPNLSIYTGQPSLSVLYRPL